MSETLAGSDETTMLEKLRATGLPLPADMQQRVVSGAMGLKTSVIRLSMLQDEINAGKNRNPGPTQGEQHR